MDKIKLSSKDLKKTLKDLVHFLQESARSYDRGFEGEAQRLAVAIRAIVHDSEQSRSLLSRLELKNISFYDNSPDYNPSIGLPFSGLALVTIGAVPGVEDHYLPRLGKTPRVKCKKVSFDEWWNKTVIADEATGVRLTREDVVVAVSNTYGDRLIDPGLNEGFNRIILKNSLGWVKEDEGAERNMMPMEFASVRHIAYELLKSLEEEIPEHL